MSLQVRTTLIHRCLRGTQPWWRNPVIYEFLGMLDAQGVAAATAALPTIAELGVQGVLLRPAWIDHETSLECVREFIAAAHEQNLRAIIRISGASRSVTGTHSGDVYPFVGFEISPDVMEARARRFLDFGADGIDMGMFVEAPMAPNNPLVNSQELSERIGALRTEIQCTDSVDSAFPGDEDRPGTSPLERITLSGSTSTALPSLMQQRLEEDLLHQLRDDTLVRVPFDAPTIRERINAIIAERDQTDVLLSWYCSPGFVRTRIHNPAGRIGWYSSDASNEEKRARSQAMDLLMLSLPGSVYLHGGDEVALVDEEHPLDESDPRRSEAERIRMIEALSEKMANDPESAWRIHRRALRIRREHKLNSGSLAWVDNAGWDPKEVLALTSGQLLILLNTSDHPVTIPNTWRPIVASSYVHHSQELNGYVLPNGACAWFEQAR